MKHLKDLKFPVRKWTLWVFSSHSPEESSSHNDRKDRWRDSWTEDSDWHPLQAGQATEGHCWKAESCIKTSSWKVNWRRKMWWEKVHKQLVELEGASYGLRLKSGHQEPPCKDVFRKWLGILHFYCPATPGPGTATEACYQAWRWKEVFILVSDDKLHGVPDLLLH